MSVLQRTFTFWDVEPQLSYVACVRVRSGNTSDPYIWIRKDVQMSKRRSLYRCQNVGLCKVVFCCVLFLRHLSFMSPTECLDRMGGQGGGLWRGLWRGARGGSHTVMRPSKTTAGHIFQHHLFVLCNCVIITTGVSHNHIKICAHYRQRRRRRYHHRNHHHHHHRHHHHYHHRSRRRHYQYCYKKIVIIRIILIIILVSRFCNVQFLF